MEKTEAENLKVLFWRIDYIGALVDGGYSSTERSLISELLKLKLKIYYFSGGKAKLPNNVKVYNLPYSNFYKNYPEIPSIIYNFRSLRLAKKILLEIQPINFIYHLLHDFNFSAALIKREFGIPLFVHADGVQRWIKKHWGKLYFDSLIKWAEEILWISSDKIFTVSSNLKKLLIDFGAPENKIIINPNGFDPSIFHPNIDSSEVKEKLGLDGKFVVGFSGTFEMYHGITYLAKAIKTVSKRIPEVVFLFVGDGSYRSYLDEIVKQDNVQKNTIITGFLPFEVVPKYLSICNVLVSPGINNPDGTEFFNSPIKNFEYMGLRKPIVATAVGQQKEIFIDKWNALLVEEKNPEAIVEAIWTLYKNPDLAEKIAINAYNDGISKHTWRHRAQNLLNVCFEFISSK